MTKLSVPVVFYSGMKTSFLCMWRVWEVASYCRASSRWRWARVWGTHWTFDIIRSVVWNCQVRHLKKMCLSWQTAKKVLWEAGSSTSLCSVCKMTKTMNWLSPNQLIRRLIQFHSVESLQVSLISCCDVSRVKVSACAFLKILTVNKAIRRQLLQELEVNLWPVD